MSGNCKSGVHERKSWVKCAVCKDRNYSHPERKFFIFPKDVERSEHAVNTLLGNLHGLLAGNYCPLFYINSLIGDRKMIKNTLTYSKNKVAYMEKNDWSFLVKGEDSPELLSWKKFFSNKKKSPEQLLSKIATERISKSLRDDELKMQLKEELFISFQEIEENLAKPNVPIKKKAVDKIDRQMSSGKNQTDTENKTPLTDYINVLEHSLLVEDINGHIPSKKTENACEEFQGNLEIQPSFHAFKQPGNDGTTSDYMSDKLVSLKYPFSGDTENFKITYESNFPENCSNIGVTNFKTFTHEESLPGFEMKPFQCETINQVYNFDSLKNTSPILDYLCSETKKLQRHVNKNGDQNCQVQSACFPEAMDRLQQCNSKKSLNDKTRLLCSRQPITIAKRKKLNKEKKNYCRERILKSKECVPMFNNHLSIEYSQPNNLIPNSCDSDNPLLTQCNMQSKRNQVPFGSKLKQGAICDVVSSKMQKPSNIITHGRNENKNVQSMSIEQTLVTVKRKQSIQEGVNIRTEENTLIKALTAPKNSNRVSIKSSVLTSKWINYKCIVNNTLNKRQLICSTPVSTSKNFAIPFHYFSSINSEETKSPSFLSSRENVVVPQQLFVSDNDSIAINSYRTQKFILSQGDRSLTFTTVINNGNQDFMELLSYCDQAKVVPFLKAYTWSNLLCTKVGEGSYGEVFSLAKRSENMTVLKIIPLEIPKSQSGQNISCKDVKHEIAVCRYMNSFRDSLCNSCSNFIKMNKVTCTCGRFPSQLIRSWCRFKKIYRSKSFNPHPGTYVDDQLFIIFEFEFGGETLEKYKIKNASEALSIFHQITMSLAVAEVECLFEHRDLHLSNVLITTSIAECIDYHIEGTLVGVPSSNVLVKIIDFTLSRLTTHEGFVLSANINEGNSLFLHFGDEQYEIYRKTNRYLGGNWKASCPYTNILWLHYILKNILSRNSVKKADTDSEKIILRYLQSIEKELLQYKSAKDYVLRILV